MEELWATVKFTYTIEENNNIIFLDMVIQREEGKISYEFYQKPTHSSTYLNYTSHCPVVTKINIIKNETRRILQNCLHREKAYPHLEKLRKDLVNSSYPNHIIEKYMAEIIYEVTYNIKRPPQPSYDFLCKIPFINELFTNKVKSIIKKSNINAKVVVESGIPILSLMKTHKEYNFNA